MQRPGVSDGWIARALLFVHPRTTLAANPFVACLVWLLAGWACATPLSASHTAKVVDQGHFEVSLGTGQNLPVGAFERLDAQAVATAKQLIGEIKKGKSITIDPNQDVYPAVGLVLGLSGLPQQ